MNMRLMQLAADYREQFQWRSWKLIFDELPLQPGQAILDLGCGIGSQARELAIRGCKVTGLDGNQELIDAAIGEQTPNCNFEVCDLREPPNLGASFDGIWCSFVAAYFTDLNWLLEQWTPLLKPTGWLALTEVENLFGHEPLTSRTRWFLQRLVDDALVKGRYDFQMGGKLRGCLEKVGFSVSQQLTLPDRELSFQGPASPEVVDAWRRRFQRMPHLQALCGSEFPTVQDDFLTCLSRVDHISTAKVICCIAVKTSESLT